MAPNGVVGSVAVRLSEANPYLKDGDHVIVPPVSP